MDLKKHSLINYHDKNKAQKSERAIRDAIYIGETRSFTIETYYGIITKVFNDL